MPGVQTLAYGAGTFTHYEDPTWVLESSNSGGTLTLKRTAPASPPNPPNQAPINFLVFGITHPSVCAGTASLGNTSSGLKQVFRYADDPPDALTATLCMEGSFALISVQDQEKRTELRCTKVSSAAVVCQKIQ